MRRVDGIAALAEKLLVAEVERRGASPVLDNFRVVLDDVWLLSRKFIEMAEKQS